MKRKVNKVGQNTLTVSLPSKWAKEYSINPGDEIEVTETDSTLTISPKELKSIHHKMNYNLLSSNGWYVSQAVRAFYHSGIDELNLTFKNKETIIFVQNEVERLLGYEILERGENSCHIRIISEPLQEEFEVLSRKVFLLTIAMAELVFKDILNKNTNSYIQVESYHDQVHRFATFCRRMLRKRQLYTELKNRSAYIILLICMVIKNNYSYLHRYLRTKKDFELSKDVLLYYKDTVNMYKIFYEAFFSKDVKLLVKLNETRDILTHKEFEIMEKTKGEDTIAMRYLAETTRLVAISGGTLISLFVDID